ncbi:uncharacterized protein LOC143023647 [Oratosquilla oratoria]|uniref:uncharacterized protein LOC143023647 n=1 Tax=Oratosquilla oratoria TaxID=337810 RepID=UPI003F769F46
MKRQIARKVVLSQPSERGFTCEEMIQIQLSHPNVLRLFCWEQKTKTLCLNLEYCSKGNLTTNMPYLSENEVKLYFKQLLDGVREANKPGKDVITGASRPETSLGRRRPSAVRA